MHNSLDLHDTLRQPLLLPLLLWTSTLSNCSVAAQSHTDKRMDAKLRFKGKVPRPEACASSPKGCTASQLTQAGRPTPSCRQAGLHSRRSGGCRGSWLLWTYLSDASKTQGFGGAQWDSGLWSCGYAMLVTGRVRCDVTQPDGSLREALEVRGHKGQGKRERI